MAKLTKASIEALVAPVKGQDYLWDSELRGFGVRVLPSGLKVFMLQYRNGEGRSRRIALGRYGVLTVEMARRVARGHLGDIVRGEDPLNDRNRSRAALTVGEVCDWYLTEANAGRLLGRRRLPIKKSTLRMEASRIERHIKPLIGTRKVNSLRTPDIEEFQSGIAAGKTSRAKSGGRGRATVRGAGAASRSISTLHSLLEHAVRMGKVEVNPARGVRRLASNRRTRRLNGAELVALGGAMRRAAEQGEHPVGLAAVRLLLLTGFRLMEGQALARDWLDEASPCILFPDTKSGSQIRVVSKPAVEVIRQQPAIVGNPYVFPADDRHGHYKQVPDVIVRLCRAAQIEGVTAHIFRHTFGSVAGELGYSELTIAGLLGHGKRGVTQGYIHIDEGLRLAVERVSTRIADLLDGKISTVQDYENAAVGTAAPSQRAA